MISIYKITSPLYPNTIYIGSTKNTIEQRFDEHNNHLKRWLNKKANVDYCYSFSLLKYGTIKLLETCDEKDRKRRELIYIIVAKTIMKCVNKNYPLCTLRCRQKISNQRYRQSEKGQLIRNCDKRKQSKKIYDQSDKCKLTKKIYRQSDKRKLARKIRSSTKVTCSICNSIVSQGGFSKHKKSKKCQKFISKQL